MNTETLTFYANIATIVGIPIAAIALFFNGWQLREQRKLSKEQKIVDIFVNCIGTYSGLMHERLEVQLDEDANPRRVDLRMRRHIIAFWDLMVTEFEYATSGFLPRDLFVRWFELLHREMREANEDSVIRGVTPIDAWQNVARGQVRLISPHFARLVDEAAELEPGPQIETLVRKYMRRARGQGLFRVLS